MPASTKQTADSASIMFAALLHDRLFRTVPFATTPAKYSDVLDPGEYYYSQTLKHGSEFKPAVEAFANQVATAIKVDYPEGVQFIENSRLALMNRFANAAISRAVMLGIAVAAMASPVGEDRMQLTFIVTVNKWQPK